MSKGVVLRDEAGLMDGATMTLKRLASLGGSEEHMTVPVVVLPSRACRLKMAGAAVGTPCHYPNVQMRLDATLGWRSSGP